MAPRLTGPRLAGGHDTRRVEGDAIEPSTTHFDQEHTMHDFIDLDADGMEFPVRQLPTNAAALPPHNHSTDPLDGKPCTTECPRHHAFDDGDRADLRVVTWLRGFTSPTYHEIADAIEEGRHHHV